MDLLKTVGEVINDVEEYMPQGEIRRRNIERLNYLRQKLEVARMVQETVKQIVEKLQNG